MKKIVSLLLVLIMTFSLSACEIKLTYPSTSLEDGGLNITVTPDENVLDEGNSTDVTVDASSDTQTSQKAETSAPVNSSSSADSNTSSVSSQSSESSVTSEASKTSEPANSNTSLVSSEPSESSQTSNPAQNNQSAHTHSFSAATCTAPKKCYCGATSGSALGHSWTDATCTTAKKCIRCGITSGSALGHNWTNATCTTPKICACGETEGDVLGHDYSNGKCKRCGVFDANEIGGKSWSQVLASMPQSLKGTKVTVYNWNDVSEYVGSNNILDKFKKETGITVVWLRVNYSEYLTKLDGYIASGLAPDVVRTRLPVPERLGQFQSLSTANFDFSDGAWDQNLMKDYTVNGVTYATSLKNTHLGSVGMMFYNKNVIEEYDMEDPYVLWKNGKWNIDKFVEMSQDYVKRSGNKVGATGMTYDKWSQMYGVAGNIAFENGRFVSKMNGAKFLTITQEFADHYNTNKIFNQGQAEIFDAGDALFYAGASVYARKDNSYFGTLKANGTFCAVPMPTVAGQKTYYQLRDEYEAYAIARGAKNPQAVPYFLRYFLDGSNYDLDTYFGNKQNLEVYNWCMAQKNTIWSVGYYDPFDIIYKRNGNQIKSYLDSIAPMVETKVYEYNDALSHLG